MPIQTHKFGWSLISSLSYLLLKKNITVVSCLPISEFPNNSFFVKLKSYCFNGFNVIQLPFLNFIVLKHLTRFLSSFLFFLFKARKGDFIFVHGIHSAFLLCAILLKFTIRVNIINVFTDPPTDPALSKNILVKLLRAFDIKLISFLLHQFDGAVLLSEKSKNIYFKNKNTTLIEGFSTELPCLNDAYLNYSEQFVVTYMGGISDAYGVTELIDSFKLLSAQGYTKLKLILCGKGDASNYALAASTQFENIEFKGFLNKSELEDIVKVTHLFINPRPTNAEFTNHSFPSKLLEYMSYGIPTLTSKLSGIPKDYNEYLFFLDSVNPNILSQKLLEISLYEYGFLKNFGLLSREFVLKYKSPSVASLKILKLIEDIESVQK